MEKEKKIEWTPDQRAAISARGCDLVVSAAAGSGKTAVLIRRIVSLLSSPENGVDAARLAVVTFTRAAAAELMEKLYEEISDAVAKDPENEYLAGQLFRLASAQISTIHSFCFAMIQENKKELGLPDRMRIGDQNETALLLNRCIEEGVEAYLARTDKAVGDAVFRLLGRRENKAVEQIEALMKKVCGFPDGPAFLREKLEKRAAEEVALKRGDVTFCETTLGRMYCQELERQFSVWEALYLHLAETAASDAALQNAYDHFQIQASHMKEARSFARAGQPFKAGEAVNRCIQEKLSRATTPKEGDVDAFVRRKEYCYERKDNIKKAAKNLYESLLCRTETELIEDFVAEGYWAGELLNLLEEIYERYCLAKQKKGILDYNDLEQLALKLLWYREGEEKKKTPLAQRIAEGYDAVFVDEYQDTNAVQDQIFHAVTRGDNLFIVGDPKQSIYRFRGAEPRIFTEHKNRNPRYQEGHTGRQVIPLSSNFRCDENVVLFVNEIFCRVMNAAETDSLYGKDDALLYGKKKEEDSHLPVEMYLLKKNTEGEDDQKASEQEATFLAEAILRQLRDEGHRPEEIAVLCRARKQHTVLAEALRKKGIPYCFDGDSGRADEAEYLFVLSLLQTLDNPSDEVALMGAMSSPVFRFTDDELLQIRRGSSDRFYTAVGLAARREDALGIRCREFLEELGELRESVRSLSLTALVHHIYRHLCVEEIYSPVAKTAGAIRRFFLNSASEASRCGYDTLRGYLHYVESAVGGDEVLDGKSGVKIMTMHGSKGLQFPVVFVSFLGKTFSREEGKNTVTLSDFGGLALSYPIEGDFHYASLNKSVSVRKIYMEDMEEEKRLLYVALTRAQKKLILTGMAASLNTTLPTSGIGSPVPFNGANLTPMTSLCNSMLQFVLLGLQGVKEIASALEKREDYVSDSFCIKFAPVESTEEVYDASETVREETDLSDGKEILAFRYQGDGLESLPKKLSVSELLREYEGEEHEFYPRRLMDFDHGRLTTSAAHVGTATHHVMQYLDLKRGKEDLDGEWRRLLEEGFLTAEELERVDRKSIEDFFRSDTYLALSRSPKVEHEKRFNVFLPAQEILGRDGEVLIQGVVDAWYENEDGTLTVLDFKTDRVRESDGEEVLRRRHGRQLALYRLAIETMTKKKVTRLVLYSFALGREVEVPLLSSFLKEENA